MAIWAAVKAMTLTLALTAISAVTVTRYIEHESHDDVAVLANDIAQAFDHRMSQNFRMAEMAAGLDVLRDRNAAVAEKRAALANLQLTFPDCVWVGVVGMDGIVEASGDGRQVGSSVKDQPWFAEGLRHPMISELHPPADMGLALMPYDAVERVIDIARPIHDPLGNMLGVLDAKVSWKWALEFRDMLMRNRNNGAGIEILVTDRDGRILIGPPALIDQRIGLATDMQTHVSGEAGSIASADLNSKYRNTNALRMQVTRWPDGGDYISAVGTGSGYQDFPGLGWNIVVRQPTDIATAPARAIRDRLITAGIALAIVFAGIGWVIADRVTGSIRQLTALARRLDRGERGLALAPHRGNREVVVLGETLNHLVDNLLQREQQLLELNANLETRIADRTALLAASNRQLEDEMAQRQAAESEREALIKQLRDQAERDPLTSALNRRAFLAMAERDRRRLTRDDGQIAIVMFDIDHFKRVNDNYGHTVGDVVIRAIVSAASRIVRASDLLCRYGGEEFVLLIADPGAANAAQVAERLRLEVAGLRFETALSPIGNPSTTTPAAEPYFQVTISLGVTMAPARSLREDGITSLLDRADQALYAAKRGGRNRTMIDQQVIQQFTAGPAQATKAEDQHAEGQGGAVASGTGKSSATKRPSIDILPKTELVGDDVADREFAARFTTPPIANDG